MAYLTYRCPTPACPRTERAARPPHWNPCPGCGQPVGFYVPASPGPSPPLSPSAPARTSRADHGTSSAVTFADAAGPDAGAP
jgi:hypothetical protein